MSDLATARAILHLMPDEVFQEYIVPMHEKSPWPFTSAVDSAENTEWDHKFMHQRLDQIAQLLWRRTELAFDFTDFHPHSRDTVECIYGFSRPTSPLPISSRNRLIFHREYIETHGRIIKPLILQADPLGLRILDGHHRVTAMVSHCPTGWPFECWIGEGVHRHQVKPIFSNRARPMNIRRPRWISPE